MAPRTIDSPYLTAKEAIAYLRLGSLSVLYWHIQNNRLPTKRLGNRYRFDTRELDAWLNGVSTLEVVSRRRA